MGHYDALGPVVKEGIERLKCCDLPLPVKSAVQAPGSQWSLWLSQFNLMNWLGLSMFLLPVCVGYIVSHYWLLEHDLVLYYTSLYAQLGLLLMAWKQL